MDELIKRMKNDITIAKATGQDPDNVCWDCQDGILISINEALALLDFIENRLKS